MDEKPFETSLLAISSSMPNPSTNRLAVLADYSWFLALNSSTVITFNVQPDSWLANLMF